MLQSTEMKAVHWQNLFLLREGLSLFCFIHSPLTYVLISIKKKKKNHPYSQCDQISGHCGPAKLTHNISRHRYSLATKLYLLYPLVIGPGIHTMSKANENSFLGTSRNTRIFHYLSF